MKKSIATVMLLLSTSSFAQNTWNNSTIETTTTNGNVGIGGLNSLSKLNINNSYKNYGLRNYNSGSIVGSQFALYNYLSTGASSGTKYGIYNFVTGTSNSKYGIYSYVVNSGTANGNTTPTAFGIYAKAVGVDSRAGYFYGDVEHERSNSIYSAQNGTKTLLYGNCWQTGLNSFTIALNSTDNLYDWDFANSFVLNRSGEMVKNINSTGKAFSVCRFGQGDVFRVYGDGTVWATSIRVRLASQFPDYVFKPDYNLMSLNEVKNYITKNGHLPNISDASTIEKDGLDLGEISVKLVEKVEELTLYLIKLNEEVEKLKMENEELKEQK